MLERLDQARDVLAQASANHLAYASLEAAMGANSTNEVMRKLSVLAGTFVPLTLVTSLWGMNVRVPGQSADGRSRSFVPFAAIVGSFLIVGFFYLCRPKEKRRGRR